MIPSLLVGIVIILLLMNNNGLEAMCVSIILLSYLLLGE